MVCNVTLGKKGQEAVAADLTAVRDESERLRAQLTAMVADRSYFLGGDFPAVKFRHCKICYCIPVFDLTWADSPKCCIVEFLETVIDNAGELAPPEKQ